MKIRLIHSIDKEREEYHRMRFALWPHHPEHDLRDEMHSILKGETFYRNELFWAVLVAVRDNGSLGGFLELSIYPKLEAYEESPIGYMEGWYVDEDLRGQGLGRRLVEAAESFLTGEGCQAIASDVEHANKGSQKAHVALGFVESHQDDECIYYYKKITK
jgi:aminoglycoside 6'-N-acetyltransferase I